MEVVKSTLKELYKEVVNAKEESDLLPLAMKFLVDICEKTYKTRVKNAKWLAKPSEDKYKVEYRTYRDNSQVEEYITSLRKEIRCVAMLYFYDGLDEKQIANILKMSEKNVTEIVEEARTKLYEMISNEGVKKYNDYV